MGLHFLSTQPPLMQEDPPLVVMENYISFKLLQSYSREMIFPIGGAQFQFTGPDKVISLVYC